MLIYNKRDTEGFYVLHKHQWKSKPFHFNVFFNFPAINFFLAAKGTIYQVDI